MMNNNQGKMPAVEDDSSHDYYPCDIIQNILSRLPLKSLIRFKSVSKSWKAMIDDPEFAEIHSNQILSSISNSQSNLCLVRSCDDDHGTYKLIEFQSQETYVHSSVKFPSTQAHYIDYLCSCQGILVFKHYSDEPSYALWNPFTGKCSTFSCPYDDLVCRKPKLIYGLCFDEYQDDYKLIILVSQYLPGKYLVYSFRNDSWIERHSDMTGLVIDSQGTYADGHVYWLVAVQSECYYRDVIMYYDPTDNLLRKLHKPGDSVEKKSSHNFLTNLRGKLCFYSHEREEFKLWLLKESEGGRKIWVMLMVANNSISPRSWVNDPICLTSKNELVFHVGNRSSVTYCLKKRRFGELKEFPGFSSIIEFIEPTCMESSRFPVTLRSESVNEMIEWQNCTHRCQKYGWPKFVGFVVDSA